ncbi:MAG TPA: hypothetical protein VFU03_11360, partial [Gemmatimonadales bacterium]|nr:hypothetical protein [Gemmatimonadales bacterium]
MTGASAWLAFVGISLVATAPLVAQGPGSDSTAGSVRRVDRESTVELPVDRLADRFALEPGVTSLDQGDLSLRGSGRGAVGLYLGGVSVTPGHRSGGTPLLGGSYFGAAGSGIGIGTNGFDLADVTTGVSSTEWGEGRGGTIAVSLYDAPAPTTGDRWTGRAGWASDAMFGTSNGLNFNRITADGSGRSGKFSIAGAAVLEGQGSQRLGLEQNASPVYLAAGVDTTVTTLVAGNPTSVDILSFTESPGIRTPSSAASSYTVNGTAGYALGGRSRVEFSAAASQDQRRIFDYPNLYNGPQLAATRAWSRVFT